MYEKNIKKILLVEDDEKNRIAALNYFSKRKDLQVEVAMDYNQAMKSLEKEKFDAAIIDLFMPQQIGNNDISLGRKIVRKIAENVDWLGERYIETMEKAMLDSPSNQPLGLEIAEKLKELRVLFTIATSTSHHDEIAGPIFPYAGDNGMFIQEIQDKSNPECWERVYNNLMIINQIMNGPKLGILDTTTK